MNKPIPRPQEPGAPHRFTGSTVGLLLAMAAVVLLGFSLRPGASSVGPVLAEISTGLDMGGAETGLLTALPGLCFGVMGLVAVTIGHRVGLSWGIVLGLLAAGSGLLLRAGVGTSGAFLILTVVALAGMAVGNVLAPAWIKRHGHGRTVLLMSLYSAMLTLGGAVSVMVSAPLATALGRLLGTGDGWRWSLAAWGLAAVVPLVLWVFVAGRTGRDLGQGTIASALPRPLRQSSVAVSLTVLFGLQSFNAYVQFGWLPQILRDSGHSPAMAGMLTSLIAGIQVLGGFVMPGVIDRTRSMTPWIAGMGVLTASGYVGLLFGSDSWSLPSVILLGIGGCAFPTAIALIPARSRDPFVTARLSGFVQPLGYIFAGAGTFLVGVIHTTIGSWNPVLLGLAVSGLLLSLSGIPLGRTVTVEDQLARRP